MPRITIFIDILGFSSNINQNIESAKNQLDDFSYIFNRDHNNVFTDFFPISDSVILITENTENCIPTLSKILHGVFELNMNAYTEPVDASDPSKVIIHSFENRHNKYERIQHETEWFPNIFRGGISNKEIESIDLKGLKNNETFTSSFYIGNGLVEAASFEKKVKGPRVLMSNETYETFNHDLGNTYIHTAIDDEDKYEMNWTIYNYTHFTDFDNLDQIELLLENEYKEKYRVVNNFIKAYSSNEKVLIQYKTFQTLLEAGIKHFLRNSPHVNDIENLISQINYRIKNDIDNPYPLPNNEQES